MEEPNKRERDRHPNEKMNDPTGKFQIRQELFQIELYNSLDVVAGAEKTRNPDPNQI